MTEEIKPTEKPKEVISISTTDILLEYMNGLSSLKDEHGNLVASIGLPVILFVKGAIVIGNIISYEKYLEISASSLRTTINKQGTNQEIHKMVMDRISKSFDTIREMMVQANTDSCMIHLENVKLINPDGRRTNMGNALWRGKLEAIDGFIIGTFDE